MKTRRLFLRDLGLSAAAWPFVAGLPSLRASELSASRKQRLIVVFSPNGTVPSAFWPDEPGPNFALKRILAPLEPFRDQLLVVKGIANRVRGDGDNHMRGMSCLLTGIELLPGNIQGGSDSPAGWASGISIDQEICRRLHSQPATHTRFASLEFGVAVPNRADPWTRMCYAGPNQPLAPIDDPELMFEKLYGRMKDHRTLGSVLDEVGDDLRKIETRLSAEDRELLEQHMAAVREMERDLQAADQQQTLLHPVPDVDPQIELVNDNAPAIARAQIDLLVNALANDMTRVATFQFMRSVGQAQMRWLGVEEGHHGLSHEPNDNADAQEKLQRINVWFAEQLAYLAQKLAATPEHQGDGSLLDNSLIVWVNELGEGNSHTLNNLPIVMLGGGCGFAMGRYLALDGVPHNRLWMAIAHAMGHPLATFGNPQFCDGGPLDLINA